MKTVLVVVFSLVTALFYLLRIWLSLPKKMTVAERKKLLDK